MAGSLEAVAPTPRPADVGVCFDGDQPSGRLRLTVFVEISDCRCGWQTSHGPVEAAGLLGFAGDAGAGRNVFLADSIALEGGTAVDCRPSPASANAHFAPAGR